MNRNGSVHNIRVPDVKDIEIKKIIYKLERQIISLETSVKDLKQRVNKLEK